MLSYDIVIVGGGPAGLAAAASAREQGIESVLILERDHTLGGILNQCIHNGFGLHTFKEELTGPEYAARFIERVKELDIEYKLNTMVMDISSGKCITAMNREEGLFQIQAKAVILAMGCRERPRGALNIPGYRPAGIFSAGTAQRLVNMEGYLPGREVVILGSGDIGLIMARRMTLEGAKVKLVAELMPYSGGLKRNIVQCLDDFGIPLKLSHTVIDIDGKERVKGVTVAQVDEHRKPIPGTEEYISCDTLLLSVGLIPENELSRGMGVVMEPVTSGPVVNESLETNVEGVFACGNVLHVHDLVDYVSEEAAAAGKNAACYIREGAKRMDKAGCVELAAEDGVRYTVPKYIHTDRMEEKLTVRFRVGDVYKGCYICTYFDDTCVKRQKRPVMAPGEMEEIKLQKQKLEEYPDLKKITIRIEKGGE
ncbi:NAD(P)/FAD-dependent oxidoreductase [Diplocloster modestus]|uniref:NAD(P)/FAD-dependent oxidoreductase n=1 Tax=Diplocloster modestus TaxID=2850322 RepID=A0ABS6K2Y3_9FIRM|nr:FAD-dependent oxidoreductase [Diplocloster modestus]MBU9724863.1 NAD(P)/FAD-dependent oxidoreductase [Diplocloster modestus]